MSWRSRPSAHAALNSISLTEEIYTTAHGIGGFAFLGYDGGCNHPRLQAARTKYTEDEKVGALEQIIVENCSCLLLSLRYAIPPPLAVLLHSPWWTNDTSAIIASQRPQVQAAVGIEHEYLYNEPFITWLQPHAHLDAVRAFAGLNGAGTFPELPFFTRLRMQRGIIRTA